MQRNAIGTYVSVVVVVDVAATVFVGKCSEDVPMIDAADHASVDATMDYADGHDFASYAAIDDYPTMTTMSAIAEWRRHDVASATGYRT